MSISPLAAQRDEIQRDLWTRTAEVAGQLNRVHGELVDLAEEVIHGKHWGDGAFRSPEHTSSCVPVCHRRTRETWWRSRGGGTS
ncbi:hypothetical protein [Pedococcus bigeumensis]|uniref:Uncharacterized protein n=1 Tax=Pedococcus bigeumensis TaxID=433644 RepID=A0A502CXK6_9MICO|nr:hypothetical protein [Pedococcus bigeumensis]TPG17260.1 hypothetical protein EAH86_10930 [Pedococcus bigeumensis]